MFAFDQKADIPIVSLLSELKRTCRLRSECLLLTLGLPAYLCAFRVVLEQRPTFGVGKAFPGRASNHERNQSDG